MRHLVPIRRQGHAPRVAPFLTLALALFLASPAAAQEQGGAAGDGEDQTPPQETAALVAPLKPSGGSVWSVFYGYGFNQQINSSAPGIDIASAGIRWAHLWSVKGSGLLRGHPSFAVEIVPLTTFVEPSKTTWAGGFNLLYEHHFAVGGRVLPVWRVGAGFLYADREIPEGETNHNFSVLGALGFDVMVTPSSALLLEYRFHHVSNANTGAVNPGVNVHTIVFGLSVYR